MKRRPSRWSQRFPKVVAGCVSVLGAAAFAENLTITVDNIRENKGIVHFFIFDADNWLGRNPSNHAASRSVDVTGRAKAGPLVARVQLESGEYGAFVYHDLNANHRLDKSFVRMPKEPFAFSGPFNERRIPRFEECMFVVGDDDAAAIRVSLQN